MEEILMMSCADILGIVILIFLIYLVRRNNFIGKIKSRHYVVLVCMTLVIIILEIMTNFLSAYRSPDLKIFFFIINVLGFSLMFMLPVMIGMLYSEKVFRYHVYHLIPSFIGMLICAASYWTHWIFWIDSSGSYHRGTAFWINVIIELYSFCVLLYAHIDMGKRYDRDERKFLTFLFLIAFAMCMVQCKFAQIQIMWGGIAVSELFYYVFLRELQFKFDSVTQVRNRRMFEEHLEKIVPGENSFIISFDVNNLKYINDNFGHVAGDEMLRRSANIIKDSFEQCGELYRTGGDEFVIISNSCNELNILQARDKMQSMIEKEKFVFGNNYYIANGYSNYDKENCHNVQECLQDADKRMYEDKKKSKANGGVYDESE